VPVFTSDEEKLGWLEQRETSARPHAHRGQLHHRHVCRHPRKAETDLTPVRGKDARQQQGLKYQDLGMNFLLLFNATNVSEARYKAC